ncbi:uncharacterized protein LOC113271539 isoform X1 [Papaver somniferum]|uniref:uncharacterized protein LOC113271539 isoform X1 n=1 Tax=Papaver somniferum TaxID=3469 RepID=UPI000E7021C5|nr:uncharacterized protein LOC113271539 isoform X1 [Papaver somniferum]
MAKAKLEAAVRRSVALILMRNSDYVGAKNKLLEARNIFQEVEFIDELITICDIMCIAELPVSEIDWYSVLQTDKGADESVIETNYENLIGTLEPMKSKFPGIKSALGLIDKAYNVLSGGENCHKLDSNNLRPCSSVKQMEKVANNGRETSDGNSSGSKRIASEGSDKSDVICISGEQPSKRIKSLDEDDCVIIAETQILDTPRGKVCTLNKVGTSLRSSSGNSSPLLKSMDHHQPWLNNGKADNFEFGQIWAAYDKEKMPRKYARINRIESSYKEETNSTENTLYVRWLRPAPINADEKKWHQAGLPVSCGYFQLDSVKIVKCNLVVFSHLVNSFQEYPYSNELVELYPREGDVWALYKDWNPFDWCSNPKTRKGCKFQIVEVLSGSSKESGIEVASLVRVAGYRNVFRRLKIDGADLSGLISPRNLFVFSHKIPAYRFRGDGRGILSGILLKLNPFAIPEDLAVDTVAEELPSEGSFSNGSSIKHPILKSLQTTLGETQCSRSGPSGALSSGGQNAEGFISSSQQRLVSLRPCEETKSRVDGLSKDEYTSNNLEMDGSAKEMVDNQTAEIDKEEAAEETDSEGEGEGEGDTLGGFLVKRSGFSDSENSSSDSDDAVNELDTGHVMAMIRRNRNTELKWQTEDEMLSSFEKDPILCMEAVCALHRHQTADGSIKFGCFSKFVALRGNEIAEFLTDNNPKGDLKKSAEELEIFIPEGLEDCKSIATFYSNQLFMIYQNKEDPLFGP